MEWIECPTCHTGYQATRCGVDLSKHQQITIACQVCKVPFDVNIIVTRTWEQTSRWNPFKEEIVTVKMEAMPRVS